MARITVEDCIDKFDSRFELVLIASNRARKLHSGENTSLEKDNDKNTVIALREIAEESISAEELKVNLVQEYQTVSPLDEEELDIENLSSVDDNKDNVENIVSDKRLDEFSNNNDENLNENKNVSENEHSAENISNENTEKLSQI